MDGTPEADLEQLRGLTLELQAGLQVMHARYNGLRHFVLEICRLTNVRDLADDRPLADVLRECVDNELDARLAKIADDDPRHAAYLKKFIEAAKANP